MSLVASANWTSAYTQVYCEFSDMWTNHSKVDYVQVEYWFVGKFYNKETGQQEDVNVKTTESGYSEHYFDYEWRKRKAAIGYNNGSTYFEYVGDVFIYNPLEEFSLTNLPEPLFHFVQYIGPAP